MLVRILACSALAAACSLAGPVSVARADFTLVGQDLAMNRDAGVVDFALTFDVPPDFYKVAADGTPAQSFQVEFDGTPQPDMLTAVVRGDEIHTANAVRVRSPNGEGGPGSGGWGPARDAVAFTVTGNTVRFAVPTADLGWTGGAYSANIFSLANGSLTAQRSVSSVPAPPAFWAGLAGLVVVGGYGWRQSVVRRRAA